MQAREIRTVIEDLEYIREAWTLDPGDPELRRGSAILRRLLVDGALERGWRALGLSNEVRVSAPNIDKIIAGHTGPRIVFFLALGASYKGASVAAALMQEAAEGQTTKNINIGENGPPFSGFTIRSYLTSSSGIRQDETDPPSGRFLTTRITRSDVIKYVANNLGGVHVGGSQHVKGRRIAERVSKFEGISNIMGKDLIFYEILAIGQCLVQSPDIENMIKKFRNA